MYDSVYLVVNDIEEVKSAQGIEEVSIDCL